MEASFVKRYGPRAAVTGAAMGLGASFAERIAAAGIDVVLVDRDADALRVQAEHLRVSFPARTFEELVCDLEDRSQVQRALSEITGSDVGLFVACAAHSGVGAWLDVPLEEKLRQIEVNCVSVATMVDVISRDMSRRGRGGIVIVSSMAGRQGTPLVATYAATKAFDLVLAESLWAELRRHGVDVVGLMPGSTRTPGFEGSLPTGATLPKGVRVMEPGEVAQEALDALGRQPSVIAGGWNRAAATIMQRLLPRKTAIGIMSRSMRSMYRRDRG